eukprot:scaffold37080_cov48-Attheya_sp.AAC.3
MESRLQNDVEILKMAKLKGPRKDRRCGEKMQVNTRLHDYIHNENISHHEGRRSYPRPCWLCRCLCPCSTGMYIGVTSGGEERVELSKAKSEIPHKAMYDR